jgi:hypothetical protein
LRFAPERGQLYRKYYQGKQQAEAKVDSCYPVALEKGHPTFYLRPLHRTAPAVQISIQTTNYYMRAENTVLIPTPSLLAQCSVVVIAWGAQIFLFLRG